MLGQSASPLVSVVRADIANNPRNPKAWLILVLFRLAAAARQPTDRPARKTTLLYGCFYRVLVEWFLGVELPWKLRVGPGLRLMHVHGLVVHDATVIGSAVTLRQNVTIGLAHDDGRAPRIGDNVDIGASAIVLGDIEVGPGATIGAGAVVVKDVPAGATVVGNPARIVGTKP